MWSFLVILVVKIVKMCGRVKIMPRTNLGISSLQFCDHVSSHGSRKSLRVIYLALNVDFAK